MALQLFETGHSYLAGFDKPWFASLSAIRSGIEKRGFDVLGVWNCKQFGPLPFATPSHCGGTWDWIGMVRRTGPTKTIELPSQVKFTVDTTLAPPGPPVPGAPPPVVVTPPPAPPPAAAAPRAAVGAAPVLIGAALLWLWSKR